MSRLSRRTRVQIGAIAALASCAALVAVVAAVSFGAAGYLNDRPHVWSPTEATLEYGGRTYEGRVFSTEGWYLVDLPNPRWRWLSVDPKGGRVSSANAPDRIFGRYRTPILGGVALTGGGKTDTLGELWEDRAGYRVRLTDVLPGGRRGIPDEFRIRLPAPL